MSDKGTKKHKSRGAEGEKALRRAVIRTACAMSEARLSPGRSGNVSCRFRDGMLITPTGMEYAELELDDIVFVAGDGTVPPRQRKPSSEWHFHLAIYAARAEMGAIVHTHSLHATVLACAHKAIPAFHYMVAVAGGKDIPLVPYATFGTEALAHNVAKGLKERNACLIANHGAIARGETLAFEVETLAEQYYKVLTLDAPHVLPDDEMERILGKFKSYGQRGQD
jgi:L-fuculose-phosphate aldolase